MICKDSSRDLMPELRRAGVTFTYSDVHVISYIRVGRCCATHTRSGARSFGSGTGQKTHPDDSFFLKSGEK